jgi:hypothetical protein
MVAPVPAQISQLPIRPSSECLPLRSPATHYPRPGSFHRPLCFQTPLPRSARGTNPSSRLLDRKTPYFHTVTNPFSRNPFLFTSMQNPRCVFRNSCRCVLCASVADPFFSYSCRLFALPFHHFLHSFPLFSIACSPLFRKHPGVGVCLRNPG